MNIKLFLYQLLYTYTSIDRYLVYHPYDPEGSKFAGLIGSSQFDLMIWGFMFSLIMLTIWIPNIYLFHIPEFYLKIGVAILSSILVIPFSRILISESYKEFVNEKYFSHHTPSLKWHILAQGLHLVSLAIFLAITIYPME